MTDVSWLLLASKIAGIGLIISSTILMATFLVWVAFNFFEFQFKRLMKSLEIQDIHQFGVEYREWKKARKEQSND